MSMKKENTLLEIISLVFNAAKYLDLDMTQIIYFSLLSKVMSMICVQLNEHMRNLTQK